MRSGSGTRRRLAPRSFFIQRKSTFFFSQEGSSGKLFPMAKAFDVQVLNTTIMGVVQETFRKMLHVESVVDPLVVEKDIIEYNSNMRVFPMEKFNGPVYVSGINFYLTQRELEKNNPDGTFVLFVKEDVAEKLLKAFGRPAKEAEDEDILMDIVGEFCNILAGNLKNELVGLGYSDISMSAPSKHKNSIPDGVPFDYELYVKQEITFTYWNQKCIVIEACMGNIPVNREVR
jgi:hypothetical protein